MEAFNDGGGGDSLVEEPDAELEGEETVEPVENFKACGGNVNPTLEYLLGIDVISDKLLGYLSFMDVKMAAETSHSMCKLIRGSNAFSNKAKLLICKETVDQVHFLVDTTYEWKAAEIDLSLPGSLVQIISDILNSVAFLQLKFDRTTKVDHSILVQFLIEIFKHAKNLKSLQMDSILLEHILHDVFSDVRAQEVLGGLQYLEISTVHKNGDAFHFNWDSDDQEEGEDGPFPRNFYQLSFLVCNLRVLRLGKISTIQGINSRHVKYIPELITANSKTLTELSLMMCEAWKLSAMASMFCPNLVCLEICARGEEATTVSQFILNQPNLESLTIRFKDKFPIQVMKAVKRKCSKLKKLHIVAKRFFDTGIETHDAIMDWNFLSDLKHLKDFAICRPLCTENMVTDVKVGTGLSFLEALPNTTREIKLRGLTDFWKCFTYDDRILNDQDKFVAISRFNNLTCLSLIRCTPSVLNDVVLRQLLQRCTGLVKLELTHCDDISDIGFTGLDTTTNTDSGISLKNLHGLTHLIIKSCNGITNEAVLKTVSLPYLRYFEYLGCISVSRPFVENLILENPSLETVAVYISELDFIDTLTGACNSLQEFNTELKKNSMRFRKIINLNINGHGEIWDENDSDSDASLQDDSENGDGDSDFSGGREVEYEVDYDYYDDEDDYDNAYEEYEDEDEDNFDEF